MIILNTASNASAHFNCQREVSAIWPGQQYYDSWATSYAGHFLIEAREQGICSSSRFEIIMDQSSRDNLHANGGCTCQ